MGRDEKQCGMGQEVFPQHLLSPPRVLWEPTCLQNPARGPGLDGGPPPGHLHQPDGGPQSLIQGAPQQPAHGREVGEIPVAQIFCSRNSRLQRETVEKKPFPSLLLEAHCTHQLLEWTMASQSAPGPPAPHRSGQVLQQRYGRRDSERQWRAPGWHWPPEKGTGACKVLPCLNLTWSHLICAVGPYLQDCHCHVALPTAKPHISKVDVPQCHILQALLSRQCIGTALIHRVQDSCPSPRRSWRKRKVLIFHHSFEGLKTFTRMLDEQPTTSGEGQATGKSFSTTETG